MDFKKKHFFGVILLLVICCSENKTQLDALAGYWEIDFVEHKGEQFIPKVGQPLYDFYHLEDFKGVRKKVVPKFDGSFQTSKDQTPFVVIKQNEELILQFKTLWDTWSEQIMYLDSTKLILFHNHNQYHYKRP